MPERQQNTGRKTKLGGFTLIELLVVISIMSMLMSILLPSLSNAREQGKRIVCLSNQRQLTMAWTMYAMNNEDRICSADTDWNDNGEGHWVADGPDIPGNDAGGTQTAIEDGMLTLRDDGWKKAIHGMTSAEEVLRVTKGDRQFAKS